MKINNPKFILFICTVLTTIGLNFTLFSQQTLAKVKYEKAEEFYNSGKHQESIQLLNEVESLLGGKNTTTLYLRILNEFELLSKTVRSSQTLSMETFDQLILFREHCDKYMTSTDNRPEFEKTFRDVYELKSAFDAIPKTKEEYASIMKAENERVARLKEEERQRKLNEEAAARLKEEEEKLKKVKDIRYFVFRFGVLFPTNDVSKKTPSLSYPSTWVGSNWGDPYTKGRVGLKPGASIGMNTLICPEKWFMGSSPVVPGLNVDLTASALFHNLKNAIRSTSETATIIQEMSNTPYFIFNLGVGPSLTVRPFRKQPFYVDFHTKVAANLILGGGSNYTSDDYNVKVSMERDGLGFRVAPVFGMNVRYKKLYVGLDFRPLYDKGLYNIKHSEYSSLFYSYSVKYDGDARSKLSMNTIMLTIGANSLW